MFSKSLHPGNFSLDIILIRSTYAPPHWKNTFLNDLAITKVELPGCMSSIPSRCVRGPRAQPLRTLDPGPVWNPAVWANGLPTKHSSNAEEHITVTKHNDGSDLNVPLGANRALILPPFCRVEALT